MAPVSHGTDAARHLMRESIDPQHSAPGDPLKVLHERAWESSVRLETSRQRCAVGCGGAPSAARNWLRQWLDPLAPISYVDAPRPRATTPRRAVARVGVGRRDRLESRGPRQFDGGRETGGNVTGPNPTDKRRPGGKRQLVVDAFGIPLAVRLTKANFHDSQMCATFLDAIPALRGRGGLRRRVRRASGALSLRRRAVLCEDEPPTAPHPASRPLDRAGSPLP